MSAGKHLRPDVLNAGPFEVNERFGDQCFLVDVGVVCKAGVAAGGEGEGFEGYSGGCLVVEWLG